MFPKVWIAELQQWVTNCIQENMEKFLKVSFFGGGCNFIKLRFENEESVDTAFKSWDVQPGKLFGKISFGTLPPDQWWCTAQIVLPSNPHPSVPTVIERWVTNEID